jgi:putative FmdB family regulatory protein
MPIYEFQCPGCNVLFHFFSRRVDTETQPPCPRCGKPLGRQVSLFTARASSARDADASGYDDVGEELPFVDDARMKRALDGLDASGAFDSEDPRAVAGAMRTFAENSGLHLGGAAAEAVARMEAGESPESIEQELGDALADEGAPFVAPAGSGAPPSGTVPRRAGPERDPTLYEM